MKKNVVLAVILMATAVSLCACGKEKSDLANNEVMIEDKIVEVSDEGLKNAAQELDGIKDADIDANATDSISLDDCRLWTTFDDFVPVTSKFCDELRFSFLFPNKAVDVGNGKLRIEGAYPTEYMVLEVEQTAHSSRYTDLIYEKDGKRIYREGDALDGKYLYFIEPDTSNWFNVELLVVGDTKDSKFTDFSSEFVTAFEKSLIENMDSGNEKAGK